MRTRDRDQWMESESGAAATEPGNDMPRSSAALEETAAALAPVVRARMSRDPERFNRAVRQTGGQ